MRTRFFQATQGTTGPIVQAGKSYAHFLEEFIARDFRDDLDDPDAERHLMGAAFRCAVTRLPERYGPRTTCYNRFVRWRKAGVWDRLMDAVTAAHDGDIQMIDSTVRAHQQAATAERGADHCLGRSRGGLTTKIHVVVDAQGLPIRSA